MGRRQIQNILLLLGNLAAPSTQAENVDVCINKAPTSVESLQSNLIATLLTGNKKNGRKKKLATILCPVIIILVESRFILIYNNFPPEIFRKTSNTLGVGPKTDSLIITNIVGAH